MLCPPQDFQIVAQQCPQTVSHCPPHRTQQVSAWEQRTARTYVRSTGCCRVPLQASSRPARAQHSPRHSQLRTAGRCRPGSGRTCTQAARPGQHRGPAPTASRRLRTPRGPALGAADPPAKPLVRKPPPPPGGQTPLPAVSLTGPQAAPGSGRCPRAGCYRKPAPGPVSSGRSAGERPGQGVPCTRVTRPAAWGAVLLRSRGIVCERGRGRELRPGEKASARF